MSDVQEAAPVGARLLALAQAAAVLLLAVLAALSAALSALFVVAFNLATCLVSAALQLWNQRGRPTQAEVEHAAPLLEEPDIEKAAGCSREGLEDSKAEFVALQEEATSAAALKAPPLPRLNVLPVATALRRRALQAKHRHSAAPCGVELGSADDSDKENCGPSNGNPETLAGAGVAQLEKEPVQAGTPAMPASWSIDWGHKSHSLSDRRLEAALRRLGLAEAPLPQRDLKQMSHQELRAEKQRVRQEIDAFEDELRSRYLRPPEDEDKEPLLPLYIHYWQIKEAIAALGETSTAKAQAQHAAPTRTPRGKARPQVAVLSPSLGENCVSASKTPPELSSPGLYTKLYDMPAGRREHHAEPLRSGLWLPRQRESVRRWRV